jgi:hypothetical protein
MPRSKHATGATGPAALALSLASSIVQKQVKSSKGAVASAAAPSSAINKKAAKPALQSVERAISTKQKVKKAREEEEEEEEEEKPTKRVAPTQKKKKKKQKVEALAQPVAIEAPAEEEEDEEEKEADSDGDSVPHKKRRRFSTKALFRRAERVMEKRLREDDAMVPTVEFPHAAIKRAVVATAYHLCGLDKTTKLCISDPFLGKLCHYVGSQLADLILPDAVARRNAPLANCRNEQRSEHQRQTGKVAASHVEDAVAMRYRYIGSILNGYDVVEASNKLYDVVDGPLVHRRRKEAEKREKKKYMQACMDRRCWLLDRKRRSEEEEQELLRLNIESCRYREASILSELRRSTEWLESAKARRIAIKEKEIPKLEKDTVTLKMQQPQLDEQLAEKVEEAKAAKTAVATALEALKNAKATPVDSIDEEDEARKDKAVAEATKKLAASRRQVKALNEDMHKLLTKIKHAPDVIKAKTERKQALIDSLDELKARIAGYQEKIKSLRADLHNQLQLISKYETDMLVPMDEEDDDQEEE